MKTREQLLHQMAVTIHETVLAGTFNTTEKLLDLVVDACEEAIPPEKDLLMNEGAILLRERILENLKKLKSK